MSRGRFDALDIVVPLVSCGRLSVDEMDIMVPCLCMKLGLAAGVPAAGPAAVLCV